MLIVRDDDIFKFDGERVNVKEWLNCFAFYFLVDGLDFTNGLVQD